MTPPPARRSARPRPKLLARPGLGAARVRYALVFSYRGGAYAGWQRQTNALAVQQVVEEALAGLLGHKAVVVSASRTDTGVHARGQVAHLDLPAPFDERGLVGGTNIRLPEDVRLLAARRMDTRGPSGIQLKKRRLQVSSSEPETWQARFHAQKSALSKIYRYRCVRTRMLSPLDALQAVRVEPDLDVGAMQAAAALLPGDHDFSAFALVGGSHRSPVRRIFRAGWWERGRELDFFVQGEGFLRGMVRSLVGTLLEVGQGKRTVAGFHKLLGGGSRPDSGPTAPAEGLVLERIFYPPPWETAGHGTDGESTATVPEAEPE